MLTALWDNDGVLEDSERGLASARAAELECLIVMIEWSKDGNFRSACKVLKNIRGVEEEILRRAKECSVTQERRNL